jgi:hypothetical protein
MELNHQPCPYVSCSSSDAFKYWTDDKNGYCHVCRANYPKDKGELYPWAEETYPTRKGSADVMSFTPKAIKSESSDSGNWVEMRSIRPLTMEKFNVKTYQDRQEYVYPSGGIKVRTLEEKKLLR